MLGECSISEKDTFYLNDHDDMSNRITNLSSLDSQRKIDLTTSKSSIRTSFFRAGSNALQEQSKWVDHESIPLVMFPLIEPSSTVAISNGGDDIKFLQKAINTYRPISSLLFLDAVISRMNDSKCKEYQERFYSLLAYVRTLIPSTSENDSFIEDDFGKRFETANHYKRSLTEVLSAQIVKAESHMVFEEVKTVGTDTKVDESLATFFNPYDKNSLKDKSILSAPLVAQGEERLVAVEFDNSLSIPLKISVCELVFKRTSRFHIDAPPLSFTIPPKSKKYTVLIPFMVVAIDDECSGCEQGATDNKSFLNSFQIAGIQLTSANRSFYLPFRFQSDLKISKSLTQNQIPRPTFLDEKPNPKSENDIDECLNLQVVPSQPTLLVSFLTSHELFENCPQVSVHLSDGENFNIPTIYIQNILRYGGQCTIKRLQISVLGLPGLPEETLFDNWNKTVSLAEEQTIESVIDEFYDKSDVSSMFLFRVEIYIDYLTSDVYCFFNRHHL